MTWTYTYEPTWNQIQTITDPLTHVTTFGYDALGNLTTITDPRNKITTLTYDAQGRPLTVKDPLNHTWTFTYDAADLATIKNPLNQTTTRYSDAVGDLPRTCPENLDRFEVKDFASWTCPRNLDRFEVKDFASCGPGELPRGHELPRGNVPERAMRRCASWGRAASCRWAEGRNSTA